MNFQKQSERPFHQDEQQFYLFHSPMPTENGKLLQQFFDERTKIENEKYGLWEEERNLAKKFDNLSRDLMEVRRRETSTVEEEIAKNAEIRAIEKQIQKIAEEKMKLEEKAEEKEREIDRTNEKINEMVQIVIEDEHKVVQQQQELEKEKKEKKVENLMAQL
ncbi:hypothetical protein IKO50_02715 [bacterium]|nr:hypothetical protein [bacterium]